MREVTKEKFKEVFLEYGKASDGWGAEYWQRFYEAPKREGMKYLVELPSSKVQNRMMVVNDYSAKEYRLFFVSEEQEENLFR
jgi:hypothetical protein